ncbi:hypothetical protein ACOSQ3_004126 [Xanthoceras sorbifolium]
MVRETTVQQLRHWIDFILVRRHGWNNTVWKLLDPHDDRSAAKSQIRWGWPSGMEFQSGVEKTIWCLISLYCKANGINELETDKLVARLSVLYFLSLIHPYNSSRLKEGEEAARLYR